MSKRSWVAGVAIGLTCLASLAQETAPPPVKGEPISEIGQEQGAPASDDNAQEDQLTPVDITPSLQRIEAAIRDLIAEEDKIERERQEEREIRDLNAQMEMALWAKRMTWATVAGILLTFVGLVLIGLTLRYTKKAAEHSASMVEEAQHATKAAEETVKVTREIGQAQVMAYLNVEYCHIIKTGANEFGLHVGFKNSGQTPARNVTVDARVSVTVRITKSANQPSVRPVDIVVGLSHGPNRRYRNRTHFSYVAAGGIVEMERDLLPSDGVEFTPPDGGRIEADFTFMIGINYQSVFPGIIQENHDWRAYRCAMISVGDKFVGRPAFDIHDAEEHFDTYKPSKP